MTLQVHQFPCLQDNYGFLIRDAETGATGCVDTPDAAATLEALKRLGWGLDMILNTHWHPDHAGGNAALKDATGCRIVGPKEVTRIAPLDQAVGEGDVVELGKTRFTVMETGGHTLGHLSYYDQADGVVFVGDTLFALGCGRVFEGTAEQMWTSLSRLAALPDDTLVYCAHEYTASNARFALSVDDSPALQARAEAVFAARERGEPTVPTRIGAEKAANPFLRAPQLKLGLGLAAASDVQAFAAVRQAKDVFKG
jgi:hydroxyacylglutathione hydrolase